MIRPGTGRAVLRVVVVAMALAPATGCRLGPDDAALRALARYERPCALRFGKAKLEVRMGEMWKAGTEGRLVTLRRMVVYRLRHGGVEVVPDSWTGPAGSVRADYSETRGRRIRARGRELDFHTTMARVVLTATDVEGKVVWRGSVTGEAPPPPEKNSPTDFKAFDALEMDLLWRSRALFISRFSVSGAFQAGASGDRTPARPAPSAASSGQSR
jgi:hypothetical protein